MKKALSILLSLVLCLSLLPAAPVHAASVYDLTYYVDNYKVVITSCERYASGEMVIPDTIEGFPVTQISAHAFEQCNQLTSVVIPESVTLIGSNAFLDCYNLISVTLPKRITSIELGLFRGCEKLTDVTIPESVTSIGALAFMNCSITSITIPAAVTSIGSGAFANCRKLEEITVAEGNNDYCNDSYGVLYNKAGTMLLQAPGSLEGEYTIPGGVTHIADRAFYGCHGVTGVTIPESVTSIGEDAFYYCSQLAHAAIPDSVTAIGQSAFYRCGKLTEVTIPVGIKTIEMDTFSLCSSLTTVTIPKSVTNIAQGAFHGCKSLTNVVIPQGVTKIGVWAFSYCESLTDVVIPDSVTGIELEAFRYCKSLTSVTIPDSVTYLGRSAFINCSKLTEVTLSESLTNIAISLFENCYSLSSVTIPAGVTKIEKRAFYNTPLETVTFVGSAPIIGENVFYDAAATVYYPANDPTWTEEVRQNYGGTLTWVPVCDEHIPGEWVIVKAPTATEEGLKEQRCSLCGELMATGTIDKLISGKCGPELTWTLDLSTGLLTITGTGQMQYSNARPWEAYVEQITAVVIEEGALSIQDCAFQKLPNLTSAKLPQSMTNIGSYAFFECGALTELTLPDELEQLGELTFSYCTSLTEVTVPRGLTTLSANVFNFCSSLTSVTLPESLTELSEGVFFGCSSLGSITLPQGITTIGARAFYKCYALKNVTIPAQVESIGSFAFYSNTMETLTFLGDAPDFASDAFQNLTATVRYPGNNATWTGAVRQQYNGTITWEPWYPVIPELTLKYPNVSFEEEVVLNVYFDAQKLEDVVEMGLITYDQEVTEWSVDNAEHIISGYSYTEAVGLYYAETQGIPAADMNKLMYFALYAKLTDGSYTYSRLVSYSPTTYAYNQLGDETMRAMVVALLNYGAAAQTYFGTDGDGLMNSELTAEQQALAESYRSDMITPVTQVGAAQQGSFQNNGGFEKRYPTVSFEGIFSIDYFVIPEAAPVDGVTMYAWDQATVDSGAELTAENAVDAVAMTDPGTGTWQASVDDIAACKLDEGVYVAFCYSDGEADYCSGVLAYSIGTYCASQANSTDPIAPFAQATAVYGYYAKQLFN